MSEQKWDIRFIELARHIASWSKDPSTQTGAVIVRPDKTIASIGYNGFPRKMPDLQDYYNNRQIKYSRIIHCEMNAILNATENLVGCTLYTYPLLSCDRCAVHVIQAGITTVVAPSIPDKIKDRWEEVINNSINYFNESGVKVRIY